MEPHRSPLGLLQGALCIDPFQDPSKDPFKDPFKGPFGVSMTKALEQSQRAQRSENRAVSARLVAEASYRFGV